MGDKIFVTHSLPGVDVKSDFPGCDVEIWPHRDIGREHLLKQVVGCVGIISLLTEKIDAEVMDAAGSQLKVIANYAVGFDNIDVDEASKRGIVVLNTPGILTESVAEHVIALMLSVSRRVVEGDRFIRSDKYHGWEPDLLIGSGVRNKIMGIVGLGRIGTWVARMADGLGMKVVYNSRSRDEEVELELGAEFYELPELLKMADVVSVNLPLNDETVEFIGKDELSLMKRGSIIINTARGLIVSEKDLIEALREKRIGGAGLDVFESEDGINSEFYGLPNVVLTPHIASSTVSARIMMAKLAINGLKQVLSGQTPPNIVNGEALKHE
jgi:glyoxylate reductase